MRKNSFDWFRLDNAAKIFPGQNSNTWSNIYRISVRLTEDVDKDTLQTALEATLRRIPSFNVRIRKGFFWHNFERNPNTPAVLPDIKNPCYRIKFKENDGFLFRVYYRGRNISVDVYHALCDGYGAAVFLSTLTGEYLRLKGKDVHYNDFVLDINEEPKKEEIEDAYLKYASSKVTFKRGDKFIYHAVGTKVPRHMNNFTSGEMSFKELHTISKSYGVTVTELLATLLLDIHYQKQKREQKKQKEVCIQIPVNLRKAFPSKTLRNFVLCLRVKIDPNYGEYTFEELLRTVSLQLRLANDPKLINSMMTQNLKLERNPVMKFLPLPVKDLGIAISFIITGEQTTTSLLSNVGPVPLPEGVSENVEKLTLFTGAGKLNGARCGVISHGDKMVFTFSNCYEDRDIEREFYTRLVKMGVHVKIESNRE